MRQADAEAIFWKVWIRDGVGKKELRQEREYYARIKIYTADGAQKYAKVDIDYPETLVQVDDVRVRTVQPDGSVVPLERGAIHSETVIRAGQLAVNRVSFAPLGLRPGCILEYRYHETRSGSAVIVSTFDLQLELPVRKLLYYTRPLYLSDWYVRWMEFHTRARTWYDEGGYDVTRALYTRPYVDEPHSPPPLQQRAWMLRYYTQLPKFEPEEYWPLVGKVNAPVFDATTAPDPATVALARRIAGEATSDSARVRLLGEWIQNEFRVTHDPVKDALDMRTGVVGEAIRRNSGSVSEAALVFASLARALGLTVRLLLAPTRPEFSFDPKMTDQVFLSAWQIGVRLDGRWQGYRPATRYLPWDMVAWSMESQPALLCDRDSSHFIETRFAEPDRSVTTRTASLQLSPDGSMEGELVLEATGHVNEDLRRIFEGVDLARKDSTLIRNAGLPESGLELSRADILTGHDERAPIGVRCHVKLPGYASKTAKRLIFEPAVFVSRRPPRFTSSTRRNPVYFPYAWSELDSIRIRIPEGWKLETLDAPEPAESPGWAGYRADLVYDAPKREVVYRRSFRFGDHGRRLVPAEDYAEVKHWFDLVHERDQTGVTLVREGSTP